MALRSFAQATKKAVTRTAVLQRQCACGNHTHGESECESCKKEHESGLVQRSAVDSRAAPVPPPNIPVNEPDDAYEQEADQVAEVVMHSSAPPLPAAPPGDPTEPNPNDLTHGGEPLSSQTATFYEERFGRDFSSVRVHSDKSSEQYNDAVNAHAFTFGDHIWLGRGLTAQPSHVLAHELTHVVQQTQPPLLEDAPSAAPRRTRRRIQRISLVNDPYWVPTDFFTKEGKRRLGEETHNYVLPTLGKHNNIFSEAPVPNADKKGVDVGRNGQTGRADLYDATTTVGIYFTGHKKPKKLGSGGQVQFRGGNYNHSGKSRPQFSGSIEKANEAPKEILLGELKPSHGTEEAHDAPKQLGYYIQGFKQAHDDVNEMITDPKDQWDLQKVGPKTGLTVPAIYDQAAGAPGQNPKRLVLVHKGRPTITSMRQRIFGKVYIKPSSDAGVLNYIWEPDDPVKMSEPTGEVKSLDTETESLSKRALAHPIKKQTQTKSRRIQRRKIGKDADPVEDTFRTGYAQWESDRKRITGVEEKAEKTPEFQAAEMAVHINEDRKAARAAGFKMPDASEKEQQISKSVRKIKFWTGKSGHVTGVLRRAFGGTFVTVVNLYHKAHTAFQSRLKTLKEPKGGGLVGSAIKVAFKILMVAGRLILDRTIAHLVESLEQGITKKLKSIIPQDGFEDVEAKIQEVQEIANKLEQSALANIEAFIKDFLGADYEQIVKKIEQVTTIVTTIKDIVNLIRWGTRIIACVSPPAWGCLWIFLEKGIDWAAGKVIETCWFQKRIAPQVAKIHFITTELPHSLANFFKNQIQKHLLPKGYEDVFADIDPSKIQTNIPASEVCDDDTGMTGQQIALKNMMDRVGIEKYDAWAELVRKHGIRGDKPLSVSEINKLSDEIAKTDLADLKDAANMYPNLPKGKAQKVISLTKFLDQVKHSKTEPITPPQGGEQPQPTSPVKAPQVEGDEGSGGDEQVVRVLPSDKPYSGTSNTTLRATVIKGVKLGDYKGDKVHLDIAIEHKGHTVIVENVEAVITKRIFTPNPQNPKKVEISLVATKDHNFNLEEKLGKEVADEIGLKNVIVEKDKKLTYVLIPGGGK